MTPIAYRNSFPLTSVISALSPDLGKAEQFEFPVQIGQLVPFDLKWSFGTDLHGSIFSIVKPNAAGAADVAEIVIETRPTDRAREKLLLERSIIRFLSLEGLEDEEAEKQLFAAVPEALVFISELPPEIPLPQPSIAFDGMVTLEWRDGTKKATAMFEGDNDYGYTYFRNGSFVPGQNTAIAGGGIPQDLKDYLGA
ncbi:hypothetical protein [Paraburkholderia tuberum]|uniref:Uncharacterized protein n=1 Tax=Paraburkholderia tuberum TaxID=157910 RepID=A0A1H1GYG3_9BURK|nr:hypothetical protein [Paraburkholderia tuberum]SDR18285.1 hypothetical protein SAMN05445850_3162 [Paraburkholderia tuberum]